MKTLQIKGGDLVKVTDGPLNFLHGREKLSQDLKLWLAEPIGTGFVTKSFGSILQDLIGNRDVEESLDSVKSEIVRVLGIYKSHQKKSVLESQRTNTLSLWSKDEVIQTIGEISATSYYDKISVRVSILTLASTQFSLSLVIGSSGVQVG